MITENLPILKIHKLTQAQYDRELEAGRIDPSALYLTPSTQEDLSDYVQKTELPTAINTALAQAKASGEFDGEDGRPGANGDPGVDGVTPHIGSNGNWFLGETDTGSPSRGERGNPGNPGMSASHTWDGSVLTITSASGISSADLKGPQGVPGNDGAPGRSPVRGVDYWTAEDIAAIDADIATELAKRGQLRPEFAQTVEECTDTTKLYVLPDGYIYAYMEHTEEVVIPGETVTVPGKAVIIKGYRYSHSGGSFSKHDTTTSIVFPIETEGITKSNPVNFILTNMLGHATYTGLYHGETNTKFPNNTIQRVAGGNFTNFTSYGLPKGKWFVVFSVQYTGTETYSNASFTYGNLTFTVGVNMEVYSDPSDASKATHASTTTTEGTTETIVTKGFVSTEHKFVADVATVSKPKSIILNNDIQPLESSISMTVPQLKKNKTIAFSGVYTGNLTEISIVQGEGTGFTECKCVVTATTITILKNNTSVYTAEHGLTFGAHFSIVLATKTQNKTKAYLSSGGNTFTTGEFVWNASRSGLKLYTNTPFTQYQFTFGSNDFDKKIWMYGDSYFDHWLPVSINRGYANCLTDGYSGGGSSSALASFKLTMAHGHPAKVVWCLGMNNKDNGAVNQSWLDCITEVKGICEANNIELWVSTIPNTPTIDNTYKNDYIRENFDHVIDLSRLVGAEDSTAWYTGLLSSDNVHPSTEGDFYIANIMETYFPEMLDV